jgi:tetratricopeptide (TPR) repeat protein
MAESIGTPDEAAASLRERLARYPADRYPIQHATAQFHLGVTLIRAGDAPGAVEALRAAARLFPADRLAVEHAKTLLMLGIALRECGDRQPAAAAFEEALARFERTGQADEAAAACYNLGLVQREAGRSAEALIALRRALAHFRGRRPGQAAACARELGAAELSTGDLAAAEADLGLAMDLAAQARDHAGLGAAANALGLTRLAAGNLDGAVTALEAAVAAHPRAVRPQDHAMAKANLALAFHRRGEDARAVLAARQALGVPRAPAPVAAQAAGILDELGHPPADVHAVLDGQPAARWPVIVREELDRWLDLPAADAVAEAGAWVTGQCRRARDGPERCEALLGGLLEQPPADLERLLATLLTAFGPLPAGPQERFRADVARAMPRFPMPQWLRLRETFDRVAGGLGLERGWG